ncbi:substrate-binding domain-containing protein [Mycolicibacterium mengxianglii]|uniref:substrate-binding domain-containing protein n=1 Tax=Mycolicibacterium mengxianglii TaxID=2736649 RepID=UPI0018EF28D7|nr:substrate-binding domain-containing protein [Mycolicibacterium mengxianglii]
MGRHSKPGPDDDDNIDVPDSEAEDAQFEDSQFDDAEFDDDARYRAEPTYSRTDSGEFPAANPPADDNQTAAFRSGPPTSGHRNDGEWTGSHRTVAPGRRGVSIGVIAALVTVVVVVAAVILWRFFGNALSDRSDVAASQCLDGEMTVAVVADPAIAEHLGPLAQKFNESASPVGDHCVAVGVQAADSDAVVDGLEGTWPTDLGDKPALWIPGSSVSSARLQAEVDPRIVSAAKSLVTSPVLLAVRPELKPALKDQNWRTLPGLQSNPTALDGLNLRGWGSLRLALPTTDDSDAAYLAAEAVAAASAPNGAPATEGTAAVRTLRAGQPELADSSGDTAMAALLDSADPAKADVHAVVTTEQRLFTRSKDLSDAKATVASWLPPGPVAVADFPAVLLGGDWLSKEQVSAASQFERFLRDPEQQAELAAAGFRTQNDTPPGNDVTSFGPLPDTLSVGDDSARVTVANALTAPASAPAVSIMLDRSLDLGPLTAALNDRITALAPTAAVALTTFDGASSNSEVPLGPLSDDVGGRPRSAALDSALTELTPGAAGRVSFTTLRNVLGEARTGFRPGQTNSVLVITAGPHSDQSLGASGLQDLVRANTDPARSVAVNVINVGDDPDRATWESVAQLSGGRYQNVPSSGSPEMTAALTTVLS